MSRPLNLLRVLAVARRVGAPGAAANAASVLAEHRAALAAVDAAVARLAVTPRPQDDPTAVPVPQGGA